MIKIVEQIIDFYLKNNKKPLITDLNIENTELIKSQWSLFVTIYINWDIRWASWNINEIKNNIVEELIENTIKAISNDDRFQKIWLKEKNNLKIRIDIIKNKVILQDNELLSLNPLKEWVLVIKKDYESMACILPNIDHSLLVWADFINVLKSKFKIDNFNENDFILYKLETTVSDNFDIKK